MSWETWGVYLAAYAVVCLTPGPAVVFVTSQSAWRGRRAGLAAALGIETSNLAFWMLTLLGLAAVATASHTVFLALKWAGAAYLAWLGVQAIRGSFKAEPEVAAPPPAAGAAWRDGFVVGMSNPKALMFFVALAPQFIDPSRAAAPQIAVMAATGMLVDFSINSGYALAAGTLRRALSGTGVKRWFDRAVGGLFLSLAAVAALYRRAI
jgi:threonine/homoserine/homoserine lactone efflux protein